MIWFKLKKQRERHRAERSAVSSGRVAKSTAVAIYFSVQPVGKIIESFLQKWKIGSLQMVEELWGTEITRKWYVLAMEKAVWAPLTWIKHVALKNKNVLEIPWAKSKQKISNISCLANLGRYGDIWMLGWPMTGFPEARSFQKAESVWNKV